MIVVTLLLYTSTILSIPLQLQLLLTTNCLKMQFKGRQTVVAIVVTLVFISWYNASKLDVTGQQTKIISSRLTTGDIWQTTSKSTPLSVESPAPGRRADDGVWFDFSDAPVLLFYAYTAFVDDRPLPSTMCKIDISCSFITSCSTSNEW